MADRQGETEIGGSGREFPVTAWTLLRKVRSDSPEARARALQPLLETYWKPVYWLIRQAWRKTNEEAKDLTQDFFMRVVLEGELLDKYRPDRGGFRSFLKASVLNFLRDDAKTAGAVKRGGGATLLRFPEDSGEADFPMPQTEATPESIFDAVWRQSALERAIELAATRLKESGKSRAFEIFKRYDLGEKPESYEEIAAAFGVSRDAVKDALKLARAEFHSAVLEIVGEAVEGPEELEREVRELLGG